MNASTIISDDIGKINTSLTSSKVSSNIMTKYEFNLLIGLRSTHLSRGSVPFVNLPENFTIITNMEWRAIAEQELFEGKLPYIIKRQQPNGKPEYWEVSQLDLVAVKNLFITLTT